MNPVNPVQIVRRFTASKVLYTGIFLDVSSRDRLLHWWKSKVRVPFHARVLADHMTIEFKPSPDEVERLTLGEKASLKVTGWAADEKGQAVVVESGIQSTNQQPPITVACAPGISPVYSNSLVAQAVHHLTGPTLTGTVETR